MYSKRKATNDLTGELKKPKIRTRNDSGYISDRSSDPGSSPRHEPEPEPFLNVSQKCMMMDSCPPTEPGPWLHSTSPEVKLSDSASSLSAGSTNVFEDFDTRTEYSMDDAELPFSNFHAGVTNPDISEPLFDGLEIIREVKPLHNAEIAEQPPIKVEENKDLSACVTNYKITTDSQTKFYKITAENYDRQISSILESCHVTDRLKIKSDNGCQTKSFVDFLEDGINFKNLLRNGAVFVSKLPKTQKREKFVTINKNQKRSLAWCQSVSRGMALASKWAEIQAMPGIDQKSRNNRFSNFQRKDRKAGEKLEEKFLIQNNLSRFPTYNDLERSLNKALLIFDAQGFVKYVSEKFVSEVVPFYEGDDGDVYFIKNLSGFSRTDNGN